MSTPCTAAPLRRRAPAPRPRSPPPCSGLRRPRPRAAPGVDPAPAAGPLERLGGVEQKLVASPGGLQLQADRQPSGREPDRHRDCRDPGQVGERRRRARLPDRRSASPRAARLAGLERRRDGRDGRPGDHVDASKSAARRRRISVRTCSARTAAAAGRSIRYLEKPRLSGLSSGLQMVEPPGRHAGQGLDVGDQDRRQRRGVEVGKLDADHLAAASPRERLDRGVAGLAHGGGDVLGDLVADHSDAQPRGLARARAPRGRASRREACCRRRRRRAGRRR